MLLENVMKRPSSVYVVVDWFVEGLSVYWYYLTLCKCLYSLSACQVSTAVLSITAKAKKKEKEKKEKEEEKMEVVRNAQPSKTLYCFITNGLILVSRLLSLLPLKRSLNISIANLTITDWSREFYLLKQKDLP